MSRRVKWQSVIAFIFHRIELIEKLLDVVLAWLLKCLIPDTPISLRVIEQSVVDVSRTVSDHYERTLASR